MRRRLSGGYSYRGRKEVQTNPILALACEGKTESMYAQFLVRGHQLRVRSIVCKGKHAQQLVDEALNLADRLRKKHVDIEVIPAVMYDLEVNSANTIKAAKEAVKYAKNKGVLIWISIPVIERWFLLHYKHISINRTKGAIQKELIKYIASQRSSPYKKPGSPQFYVDLLNRADVASQNCSSSHLAANNDKSVPCLCQFIRFVKKHRI